jgi:hypothetical protein
MCRLLVLAQVLSEGNGAVIDALSRENGTGTLLTHLTCVWRLLPVLETRDSDVPPRPTGALLKLEPYEHKYPYDWRTKKPVITRATSQWFASVANFRDAAVDAIDGVQWVPETGRRRITPMVAGRSDWCVAHTFEVARFVFLILASAHAGMMPSIGRRRT